MSKKAKNLTELFKDGTFSLSIAPKKAQGDALILTHPKHPGQKALVGFMGKNIISVKGGVMVWGFGVIPSSEITPVWGAHAKPLK